MSIDTETNDNFPESPASQAEVAPFERWLDKKLKGAYGAVLEEPIPQDIIDLLKKRLDRE